MLREMLNRHHEKSEDIDDTSLPETVETYTWIFFFGRNSD